MATIATLNTVFSATTDKFSAGTKAAQRDLSSFERAVDKLQKKLFSLEGAFKIGTGVGFGSEVISKLHQGIGRAVSALADGVKEGQSFTSSLEDAARAAFGMETGLAQATKRAKEYHDVLGKIREGQHAASTAPGKDATMNALQEAVKKAQQAAAPGLEEIRKARVFADMPSSIAHGEQSLRIYQLRQIEKKWANQLALLDIAESALGDYVKMIESQKKLATQIEQAWSQIKATIMGGAAKSDSGIKFRPGLIPNLGATAANAGGAAANALGPLANLAGVIGRAVAKAANIHRTPDAMRLMEKIRTPQEKFDAEMLRLDEMFRKGEITDSERTRARFSLLQDISSGFADTSRRAGGPLAGSAAAASAITASQTGNRTEKDILKELERQTKLQQDQLNEFQKNKVVSISA